MTLVEQRRMMAVYCQHQVMALLGVSEEAYCWFKYRTGIMYLEHYLNGDSLAIDLFSRSEKFWQWWKVSWTVREEDFILVASAIGSANTRKKYYKRLNNPLVLALEIRPYINIITVESTKKQQVKA